ncbi:MAG: CHAT domain-containing protein [Polyangiaceae bacterium]|nr:CHAT domain-containing protein [Polyangiaceae bacterium]
MRVFLSHSTAEKDDIQKLRKSLEDRGIRGWEDVLELRLGDGLSKLRDAIRQSDAFILLLSPKSIGADWVQREIAWALEEHSRRPEFRLMVLLRGMESGTLRLLFGAAEPLCFRVPDEGPWIDEATLHILRALGKAPSDGLSPAAPEPAPPMCELTLTFTAPTLHTKDGTRRAAGSLRLTYTPVEGRGTDGASTNFVSPLGPIEAEDLRWYVEDYVGWPFGTFRDRAKQIEANLPKWGKLLYDAITTGKNDRIVQAFLQASSPDGKRLDKRITVSVDDRDATPEGKDAAALLFGLPWELLHDERSYLFDGNARIRVRRTLPSDVVLPPIMPRDRVRVLLVRARPEDKGAGFLDPRSSVQPLAETLRDLGDRVKLDLLPDGTLAALQRALSNAEHENDPYQIVHFDGHGVYDKVRGLGLLCFEDADDAEKGLDKRRAHNVPATEIGSLLRDRRVPLFVLDACQTAMADAKVDTSVAAELLRQGVVSVVAMRYSVLVATAGRFVRALYGALAQGHRIGTAMVEAQQALKANPSRFDFGPQGRLELQDWMVPVLFQEGDDPRIFAGRDGRPAVVEDRRQADAVRRGELPPAAKHGFVGRARELLRIERRLVRQRRVAIVGPGGEGKTALATEAARWMLLTQQRERVAFVSVERLSDARAVVDAIGRQLVSGFSVATADAKGMDQGKLAVKSALLQRPTLLVVDNFESLIALSGKDPTNAQAVQAIVNLVRELADVTGTWLITTSRESLPAPLDGYELRLDSLDRREARELLVNVLRDRGIEPPREGKAAEDMENVLASLIEAVRGHARSLVLLGPTLATRGIAVTRDAVAREMVALEKRSPGDRENSLLASVRLSLARLDEATRKKLGPLCVFRQAAPVPIMAHVLEIEPDDALELCRQLVALGLADANGAYLLPDPALGEVLALELDAAARAAAETRWREGMRAFAGFLYEQHFQDASIAAQGTTIALLDLLDALEATAAQAKASIMSVDAAMQLATSLEQLVSKIGQPRALSRVRTVREALTKLLPAWSHARFSAEAQHVDRLLEVRNMRGAFDAAKRLRDQAEAAGDVYPEAAYDRAMAWAQLGRVLKEGHASQESLGILEEARTRFATLAAAGDTDAVRMENVCIKERGDALRALGQLDAAAAKYEQAIGLHEKRGDKRAVATGRGQLGTVRLMQRRFGEALELWQENRRQFEALGEPAGVAIAWHQIGIVHQEAGNFAAAEHAYKESLRLTVSLGNRAGEAGTLGQLGNLYHEQGRLEDAVALYRQVVALYETLGDVASASLFLYNLGDTLRKLNRLDEAREALTIATRIDMQIGHAAEPWKTWSSLADVERDAGNAKAAANARAQAMETYRAYRDAGGEAMNGPTRLVVAVGALLQQQGPEAAAALMKQVHASDAPDDLPEWVAILRALDAIVAGSRDPALAADPLLEPIVAVELQMLLEALSSN